MREHFPGIRPQRQNTGIQPPSTMAELRPQCRFLRMHGGPFGLQPGCPARRPCWNMAEVSCFRLHPRRSIVPLSGGKAMLPRGFEVLTWVRVGRKASSMRFVFQFSAPTFRMARVVAETAAICALEGCDACLEEANSRGFNFHACIKAHVCMGVS